MRHDKLFELLSRHLSPERICKQAEVIHNSDRWNSFDGYKRTADMLAGALGDAGADSVERIEIPCDGKFVFGDWVMPLAWDAQEGLLELIGPGGRREMLLADYRAVPNNLIRWSRPTAEEGEVFELVRLSDGMDEDAWKGADVAGKMVFVHCPADEAYPLAAEYGAAGLVTDYSTQPAEYGDAVQWCNRWSSYALWGFTRQDKPMLGFSLTPNVGKELTRRLKGRRKLKVRATVKARFYEGTSDIITATITGAERPEQEIVFYAHVYECQLDDNAVSAAMFVEMVRVIHRLIQAGLIERPARTIRFMLGWEWIGSTYYAMHHRRGKDWLASICCDALSFSQEYTKVPIDISLSPTFATSFADAWFVQLWKDHFAAALPMVAWRTTGWNMWTDTNWIDPDMGCISNVYPTQPLGHTWHKSHTNAGMVDRQVLRNFSLTCLTWAWTIASADPGRARRLARIGAERIERRIRRCAGRFDFSRPDTQLARAQLQAELGYLRQAGRRAIDTTALASDDAPTAALVDALNARIEAAIDEETRMAEERFARTAAIADDWEAHRPLDLQRDRDQRIADNMVPSRRVKGYLWSLHRFSHDDRRRFQSYGRIEPLALFLADGERSLGDIIRRCEFEKNQRPNLRNVIRQFRMLADAGYVEIAYKRTFDTARLSEDLRRLGVAEGDTILVHSSLSSLGPLAGGPDAIFAALDETVGASGTVCLPTFTYSTVDANPPYDLRSTPSRTGELTNLFLRRPGAVRSGNASHSLAATGRRAEYIIADDADYSPCDMRGAFGKLYQLDAKVVMIGCGLAPNTTLHAVEDWANLPSMQPRTYHYVDPAGRRREVVYEKVPVDHREFYTHRVSSFERLFRREGLLREGDVGLARAFLMRSRDIIDRGIELVRNGSFEFLFGDGTATEALAGIMDALRTSWSFPADLPDKIKALRKPPR